jgi:probable F420-dependent oxidoreductase
MLYVDRIPDTSSVEAITARARRAERLQMAGLWSAEAARDPFLPLVTAATATSQLLLGTGIAVAYARSPYATAMTSWDLQRLSGGRFRLGLATQVRPHIERRFGMPWPGGVGALRDYVATVRAVLHTFQTGEKPDHRGPHYQFTLMNPEFQPEPLPGGWAQIPIWLAAVGPASARLAGEIADGLHVHAFHTPAYLRDVLLAEVASGRARAGSATPIQATCPVFAGIAHDDDQARIVRDDFRGALAFYASTPGYRAVLEHEGLGDLHEPLHELSRQRRWADMSALIDDDVLDRFAIVDAPAALGARLRERYDGLLTELALYRGGDRFASDEDMDVLVRELGRPAVPVQQ